MANSQTHRSDPAILGPRTLERDHRHLRPLLRPGIRALDVGCGTGSITASIAKLVGPAGFVTGLDRDEALLEIARSDHAGVPGLRFEAGDVLILEGESEFDAATAARALQWIADPAEVVRRMARAVKPGGMVVASTAITPKTAGNRIRRRPSRDSGAPSSTGGERTDGTTGLRRNCQVSSRPPACATSNDIERTRSRFVAKRNSVRRRRSGIASFSRWETCS